MKRYLKPETESLELMAQAIICASGASTPVYNGSISSQGQENIDF